MVFLHESGHIEPYFKLLEYGRSDTAEVSGHKHWETAAPIPFSWVTCSWTLCCEEAQDHGDILVRTFCCGPSPQLASTR